MNHAIDDLWRITTEHQHVDAAALAAVLKEAVTHETLDARTRLLVRDSFAALEHHWGAARLREWLVRTRLELRVHQIAQSAGTDTGFPSLENRIVDATKPESVRQFLRELATHIRQPARLIVGGAIALILENRISRHTEDIDVVDEVPAEIRSLHRVLDDLAKRYGIHLTHFQSHYLPSGWQSRLHSTETFGPIHLDLIDVYDIFVGKLFSVRIKDRDDLRELIGGLDRATIEQRLKTTTTAFRSDAKLQKAASDNWFILFGQELPV